MSRSPWLEALEPGHFVRIPAWLVPVSGIGIRIRVCKAGASDCTPTFNALRKILWKTLRESDGKFIVRIPGRKRVFQFFFSDRFFLNWIIEKGSMIVSDWYFFDWWIYFDINININTSIVCYWNGVIFSIGFKYSCKYFFFYRNNNFLNSITFPNFVNPGGSKAIHRIERSLHAFIVFLILILFSGYKNPTNLQWKCVYNRTWILI